MHLGFKKFQNNVKRNVKRTSLFYNYNRTIHPLRLPIKQNKNKNENLCRPLTDMSELRHITFQIILKYLR